ncbi:peroxiredoxin family protein [Mucilaginibacter paludis]|uniref:Alkyl hydroperoxide reductase/ Thiol specific antioxidant/ Mal allergen n=1 Tax=Mucilaginibacter paludis DSM 18603 TaxID=714943 RepID=H1Y597_9SPHI|nr:redoxin domain-containing protein [Mucilaginibacter paludis]EHQ28908.1 alkyl hydroperoxide reductase/ Thiol specific antioxidant/ Mal allergen [Mucilaginibacter paludis DSM 18603]
MSSKTKYRYFNSLEIILENDFVFKLFKPLIPVKAGNIIPDLAFSKDFGRWQQYTNGAESRGLIPFTKLKSKPIVLAFYSQHWGQLGIDQLVRLNELQHEVKAAGANLIVISPQKESFLNKLAWEYNFTLTFYFDLQNEVARQFRVYHEDSPVWNLFSGVDENVPLLASYVVNPSKHVVYQHIDYNLSGTFSSQEILRAVYEAAHYTGDRKSA